MIAKELSSRKIAIKCKKCETELKFIDLIILGGYFGIIFLNGTNDGYFGITCPNCRETILKHDNRKNIESIKNSINRLGSSSPYPDDILRYHYPVSSSLIRKFDDEGMMEDAISTIMTRFVDNSRRMEPSPLLNRMDCTEKGSGGYCTYFLGDLAIGPAMTAIWFKKKVIGDVLETENKTGLRALPRYRFYDPAFESIDDFCWTYHTELDYVEWTIGPSGTGVSVEDFFTAERKFDKASDFLKILGVLPHQQNPSYPSSLIYLLRANQVPMNHLFESPCKNRKDLMNQLWKNFSSEKVQEGLSVLSNRFIYEYLELMEKINSSPESIWNLKEKYLIQLSDYIGSPSGKKRTIKQVPTAEIEEVLKAEQTFPSVKIISQDPEINDIKINLSRLSQLQEHKIDFLLIGETGTGKELFAKAISESSNRRGKFVAINCAEISHDLIESKLFGHKKGAFTDAKEDHKGYFEQANEGTLFLDEIGELGMELQAKLLRAVQEKEIQPLGAEGPKKIDVRMIFATNRDLDKMVELREFRRDLLQRINRFTFRIPPLRERKMDIPILADYFIHEYDKDRQKNPELEPLQIAPECVDLLNNHQWKGNVRELENVISNVVIMKAAEHDRTPITAADLPQHFAGRTDILLKTTHKNRSLPGNMKVTDDQIREAMEQCNNNKSEVARRLGVDKRTIRRRWKNLEI